MRELWLHKWPKLTSPTDTQTLISMIIFERHFVTFEYYYDFVYLICETDRDIWNDTSVFIDCKNIIYHREQWIITYLGWIGTGFFVMKASMSGWGKLVELGSVCWKVWWGLGSSRDVGWGWLRLGEVREDHAGLRVVGIGLVMQREVGLGVVL